MKNETQDLCNRLYLEARNHLILAAKSLDMIVLNINAEQQPGEMPKQEAEALILCDRTAYVIQSSIGGIDAAKPNYKLFTLTQTTQK